MCICCWRWLGCCGDVVESFPDFLGAGPAMDDGSLAHPIPGSRSVGGNALRLRASVRRNGPSAAANPSEAATSGSEASSEVREKAGTLATPLLASRTSGRGPRGDDHPFRVGLRRHRNGVVLLSHSDRDDRRGSLGLHPVPLLASLSHSLPLPVSNRCASEVYSGSRVWILTDARADRGWVRAGHR